MNKKGFTLVEVIIVMVIIGIILVLAIPNILDEIEQNRINGAKAVEKLLKQNLEMYNNDKMYGGYQYLERTNSAGQKIKIFDSESDLWENEKQVEPGSYCTYIYYDELIGANSDIKMGECLLTSPDKGLVIERIVKQESSTNYIASYKYYVNIVCGKHLASDNGYTLSSGYNEGNIYYKTADEPNCK